MRGSQNRFSSKEFHSICDGKGPTLTVIQSDQGFIFGGYASLSWGIAPRRVPHFDPEAFLFSLSNQSIHR